MLVLPEELDVDEGPDPDVEPVSLAVEVAGDVVEVGMSDWLVELDTLDPSPSSPVALFDPLPVRLVPPVLVQ